MFGDPHIITLDRTSYTFNGHGEFVLLETPDFALHGRVEPLSDAPDGSVLTAVAAQTDIGGSRVMVSASTNNVEIFVNDMLLNRREFAQNHVVFDNFSISLVDRTATLQFTNGINVECEFGTRGFINKLVVGVPRTFMGLTMGLLGGFNGDPTDDLMPAPVDSDLRTIHEQFGLTCE